MGANFSGAYNKGQKQRNGRQNNGSWNSRQGNGVRNNGRQNTGGSSYVGAPYNFVPFSKDVYHYPKGKQTKHNDMSEDLLSGEISYEMTAKTPIFVGDGRKDEKGTELFHKNERGSYAIPGSTVRGLIRNNVQILGLSEMGDDVDDYALMYRAVAGGMEKRRYGETLGTDQINVGVNKTVILNVLRNVKAGYIREEGGKYFIREAKEHAVGNGKYSMNYYVLSEKQILENQQDYPFFTNNPKKRMMYNLNCEFRKDVRSGRNGKKQVKYIPNDKNTMVNKDYKPYYEEVSYELSGDRITKVGEKGQFCEKGYVLSSGFMNEKKAVYIIPEMEKDAARKGVLEDDVRAFRIDLSKRENTLKRFGGKAFFDLPDRGECKPVFFIQLKKAQKKRLYFGFTPRLRLFYDHTIKDGLVGKHKEGGVDYAKAIFGYVKEEGSYRSKVSFTDAVVKDTDNLNSLVCGEKQALLLDPKPTSYMDYVKPDEKGMPVTYNKAGFSLRGVKQYWLKKDIVDTSNIDPKLSKVTTKFQPLDAGVEFAGKVRFQNLTQDELGLLLWSIRLNKNSEMNVGKGKPYGYGRIKTELKEVKIVEMQRAYGMTDGLELDPFRKLEQSEVEECIIKYKDTVNDVLPKGTIDNLPHIQEFFMIKDAEYMPDNEKTRYMSLEGRPSEYQERIRNKQPLDTIRDVIKKK